MTFEEVLKEAVAMLQRLERVSYRSIQRQFDLNDAYFEDLKEALLYTYSESVNDDGQGLIWAGGPLATPSTTQPETERETRFHALLPVVIAFLQREGRVTYRTLKYACALDDSLLAEICVELRLRRLAIDEEGGVLAWRGKARPVSSPLVIPTDTPTQGLAESAEVLSTDFSPEEPIGSPESAHSAPKAERRQLTVMFCDLVGSTDLSGQLDPEEFREVVQAYQEEAAKVIEHYEGHIAQYLGDGLLIYFGWPQAHENDAERAVYTGLEIPEAIARLNTRLEQDYGVQLAVRIGIHTGLVVVGEMGGGGRHESLALGETPNIAARLEGLAQPNTVSISPVTAQLIHRSFILEELGKHELKGVAEPMPILRVLQPSGAQHRLDISSTRGLTPLVGRNSELQLLIDSWYQVKSGEGQVVLLNAEPGLGKSRMVQALREHLVDESCTRLECRSSPYYQNTALYPVTNLIQRTLGWKQNDNEDEKRAKLEQALSQYRLPVEETMPLMASLLALSLPEDTYPPLNLTPQRQRQKTLEAIVSILVELAEHEPVLFIVEDLHWTDPSTLELLDLLVDQSPTVSIYTLLTCRPEFRAQWVNRSYFTQVTLNRLSHDDIEQMVATATNGKPLPDEIVEQLVEKTDGVPLYVEEMTKSVLESGVLKEADGRYELAGPISSLAIPATLQDSLMARLDRLVTAKGIAQYGAVIGRQFSYELLQAVAQLDDMVLERELGLLVDAELVYQRGLPPQAIYIFKHALVQDTAYKSLLRSTRQGYHRRIAEVLAERFHEISNGQPELLAHHYTVAGLNESAIGYWQEAGELARQRSANVEAISHFNKGLELLQSLPETPERLQQELDLQVVLGLALRVNHGHAAPEVERAYARARQLCEKVGNPLQLFPILRGLLAHTLIGGYLPEAHDLGEQLLDLATSHPTPEYLMLAHNQMGQIFLHRGHWATAYTHFTQVLSIYNPQQHRDLVLSYGNDLGVSAHGFLALVLWQLGHPDQGIRHTQETHLLAHNLSHPYCQAFAQLSAAISHQRRREVLTAYEQVEAAMTLAKEQGFALYVAGGTVLHGWALAMQGQEEAGIAEMREGITAYLDTGSKVFHTYFLGLLAEAYGKGEYLEEGLNALAEAMALTDETEVRFYESELHRLKGQLLFQQSLDNYTKAESCFQQAIAIAQRQQAKSWELRAATSLARLWQSQGKHQEAYDLLTPVYEWFTEGFDTVDLKDAKMLLSELEE